MSPIDFVNYFGIISFHKKNNNAMVMGIEGSLTLEYK
jgi:hypothetical protein